MLLILFSTETEAVISV